MLLGVLGEDGHRHVRVDGAHLLQDGFQNGIVSGVAAAIGAADHHAVPARLGPGMAAEDLLIDMELGVHRVLDGELRGGLFVEPLPHAQPQDIVVAQGGQMTAELLVVTWCKEKTVHILVDEIGDATDSGSHGGQMEAGALRQGVGERLRKGGEGVDVQSGIELVHAAADPPGKGDLALHPQLLGQGSQLLSLLTIACDDKAKSFTVLIRQGKAAYQSGHVLHGVQPGSDAYHHAVLVHIGPQGTKVCEPVPLGRSRGEIDAVINGVEPVGGEAPGDQQVHHGVGNADAVVQLPQGPGIDGAEGQMAEGAAHVVQLVVAVDRADHRQPRGTAQQRADHIGPGAVAVDQLVAALADIVRQLAADPEDIVAAADHGGDAEGAGLVCKGAVPETDQLGGDALIEVLQQTQHVGLGAAGVSAADEMDDFHKKAFLSSYQKWYLWNLKKYYTMFPGTCP